jgi:hypothetical protein
MKSTLPILFTPQINYQKTKKKLKVRVVNFHTLQIHYNEINSNNTMNSGNELSKKQQIRS